MNTTVPFGSGSRCQDASLSPDTARPEDRGSHRPLGVVLAYAGDSDGYAQATTDVPNRDVVDRPLCHVEQTPTVAEVHVHVVDHRPGRRDRGPAGAPADPDTASHAPDAQLRDPRRLRFTGRPVCGHELVLRDLAVHRGDGVDPALTTRTRSGWE